MIMLEPLLIWNEFLERSRDLTPIQHRPELFKPLLLPPNTISCTHPRMLVHRYTKQRANDHANFQDIRRKVVGVRFRGKEGGGLCVYRISVDRSWGDVVG